MKILIFHSDIQYVVRMEKKMNNNNKKKWTEKNTNGFVSLPTKFHLAHFTCCLFWLYYYYYYYSTIVCLLCMSTGKNTGDFLLALFFLLPWTAKMLETSKLQVFYGHWYQKENFIIKLVLWPFDFQQIKDDKVDSRIPSAHVLSLFQLVRGAKNKT